MQIINISIKELSIDSFRPVSGYVDLNISYNNPEYRIFKRTLIINKPDELASELLKKIKSHEQDYYFEFDGEKPMDNYVHVIIEKEHQTKKELANFLQSINSKIKEIQNKKNSEHYLDLVNNVLIMKKRL